MSEDTIPRKMVELSELRTTDKKARWLFILADGRRDLQQICKQCKISREEGVVLIGALVEDGFIRLDGDLAVSDPQPETVYEDHSDEVTATLVSGLADYLGPVAEFIVQRDYKAGNSEQQLHDVIMKLSSEIEDLVDRERFITVMVSELL